MKIRNRITWALGASVALSVAFLLCRYTFFALHGMMQWPFVLFVFGLISIIFAAIFNARKVMVCTVMGYMLGFVFGTLFHWDSYHPERGPGVYTNNNWALWTLFFFLLITLGIIWEFASKRKRQTGGRHNGG